MTGSGSVDLGGMRKAYKSSEEAFTENKLVAREPFAQFDAWFKLAAQTRGIEEPNAMCLATATKDGRPSARMVLLKGYGPEGFKFFTNYDSRKGKEMSENPFAALNFYWEPLKRCVRVEGRIEKLTAEESSAYFDSRPFSSRIGAAISPQSCVIPNREFLTRREEELKTNGHIARPNNWGGFLVIPDVMEFWQGQTTRIHDRVRFRKLGPDEKVDETVTHTGDEGWVFERLAP